MRHGLLTLTQNRSRDYSNGVSLNNNGTDTELAHASPWGKNIWNAPIGTFPLGSKGKGRDNSRPRGMPLATTP
jgi:hypothetical protein